MKRIAHPQDDARATLGQHGNVTRELNRIAETFVLKHEDGLVFEIDISTPKRLREPWIRARTGPRAPPRLASRPTGFEIAGQQLQQGQMECEIGIVWIERLRLMEGYEGLIEPSKLRQGEGLVDQCGDAIRPQGNRLVEPCER